MQANFLNSFTDRLSGKVLGMVL